MNRSGMSAQTQGLPQVVETIRSRQDLADFVRLMLKDLAEKPEGWENKDLSIFLESSQHGSRISTATSKIVASRYRRSQAGNSLGKSFSPQSLTSER